MGTELMTAGNGRNGVQAFGPPATGATMATAAEMSLADVMTLAGHIAAAGMLGFDRAESVFAVMMLCQAEKLHPMEAVKRYHIIKGRPSMRADYMLAEFQRRGGRIKWLQSDCEACEATATHPQLCPDGLTIRMTLQRFVDSKVAMTYDRQSGKWSLKDNWANFPDALLRARVSTALIRAVDPGVVCGMPSQEELQDVVDLETIRTDPMIPSEPIAAKIAAASAAIEAPKPKPTPAAVEPPVWGQPDEIDARPYHEVVSTAVGAFNSRVEQLTGKAGDYKGADVHRFLWYTANQKGWDKGEQPKGVRESIERLTKLYKGDHRKGLRDALQSHLDDGWDVVESAYIDEQAEAAEEPPPAAEAKPLEGSEAGLDG